MMQKHAKKGGVVTSTVIGVGMLIVSTILILVVVSTLNDANLLSGDEKQTVGNLTSNFTDGIDEVARKIPTILLIVAVVFLFGALVLLIRSARGLQGGGGGGL